MSSRNIDLMQLCLPILQKKKKIEAWKHFSMRNALIFKSWKAIQKENKRIVKESTVTMCESNYFKTWLPVCNFWLTDFAWNGMVGDMGSWSRLGNLYSYFFRYLGWESAINCPGKFNLLSFPDPVKGSPDWSLRIDWPWKFLYTHGSWALLV